VLPRGLQFLLSFNDSYFNVQNRASDYLSFAALFLLAFGAVFEMPVIIVLAVRLGVVRTAWLRKNRKYAVIVNAVIAMVVTPSQDAFSMLAMLIPLLILYEISIVIGSIVGPKEALEADAPGSEGGPPDGGGLGPSPA
jgi:sec-independent protein translocase protein TatC